MDNYQFQQLYQQQTAHQSYEQSRLQDEGKMEEARSEEIAAEIKKLRDDAGKAFREAVEREKELLQEYEKLTDQPFDDE